MLTYSPANTQEGPDRNGIFHVYIYPAPPTADRNPRDTTDTRSFWGPGQSHVHIIFGGPTGFDVQNGVMTINLTTQGQQRLTGIWHPRLQRPAVQPRDMQEAEGITQGLSDDQIAAQQQPPFQRPTQLNMAGVAAALDEDTVWFAVQLHIRRDSANFRQSWQTLVNGEA